MRIIRSSKVSFASENLQKDFDGLNENNDLKRQIKRAIQDIQLNAFCSIPVPKRLIPKEYIKKYGITNLWKYDLPDGWRLLYTITTPNKIEIISIILEWLSHPDYERKFHYK